MILTVFFFKYNFNKFQHFCYPSAMHFFPEQLFKQFFLLLKSFDFNFLLVVFETQYIAECKIHILRKKFHENVCTFFIVMLKKGPFVVC